MSLPPPFSPLSLLPTWPHTWRMDDWRMGIYLTGGKEGNYCQAQQVTALRSRGWCLATVGQAEAGTQSTPAPSRCLELFVPQGPVPKHRCLPPALGWLPLRVEHSCGAHLSWFSCALLRVQLAGARSPVDPRTATSGVCTLLWLLTL